VSRGVITTVTGGGQVPGGLNCDGMPATSAALFLNNDVDIDSGGNLFITDFTRIRRVDAKTGIISTVAGSKRGYSGDGGIATNASFFQVSGLTIDKSGTLFIADPHNNSIRAVKGIAEKQQSVIISDDFFSKPNLIIKS